MEQRYKRIQSWESLESNVAEGNKLSNEETYVGVASHLHRRSAYRVQHQAHVLRTLPVSPTELINRLITADPLSSTRSLLSLLSTCYTPSPSPTSPRFSRVSWQLAATRFRNTGTQASSNRGAGLVFLRPQPSIEHPLS